MGRATVSALCALATFASSSCTTEVCACSPPIVPAILTGDVLDSGGAAATGAHVRAYSGPAAGCHSLDTDFGFVVVERDGSFIMGLASGQLQDSVCVLVFARPPLGSPGPENSDTSLLVMDFRSELTADSARIELVLRAQELSTRGQQPNPRMQPTGRSGSALRSGAAPLVAK
jgi:hypothetical protein